MPRTLLALLAFLLGVFLVMSQYARGIRQVDIPNVGSVFVWTPEEMDKLDGVLKDLLEQRDKLTKKLSECRAGT